MIDFACASCGRKMRAAGHLAGKHVRCPDCGEVTPIPPPPDDAAAGSAHAEPATLARAPAAAGEGPATATLPPPLSAPGDVPTLAPDNSTHPVSTAAVPAEGVTVPGFEIVRELGRGGMGVVYEARQLQPRRPVALKMVLAGDHAGADQLARFHTEAQAAARLQHPNIVQVHEVGEQAGRPFLVLEYVEGGNLARFLHEHALDAGQAAELIRALARAVHHAHQKGIIHRDLKPANVLLRPQADDGAGGLPWLPKIADFGLAKQLEGLGSITGLGPRTQSGAVLGTPQYMAPEQAQGKGSQAGPAVDVYALGTILYELLTGRPPLQGETTLDTLMKVVSEEPAPPRQVRPQVPRDLETICLKCLHKDPARRYASAADLAEDLRRFLAGEPIKARRQGTLERLGRWLRRKKELVYLLAGAATALILTRLFIVPLFLLETDLATSPGPGTQIVEGGGPPDDPRFKDLKPAPGTGKGSSMVDKLRRLAALQESQNNLKMLAIGLHALHDTYGQFPPPASYDPATGQPLLSWRVHVLPFIEQVALYKQFHLNEPWDSPNNKALLASMPDVYKTDWGLPQAQGYTYYQAVTGPQTVFELRQHLKGGVFGYKGVSRLEITDGTSNTLLLVEAAPAVPWTKPDDLTYDPKGPPPKLSGPFEDLCNVVLADGHVGAVKTNISPKTLRALITRNGGETIDEDWQAGTQPKAPATSAPEPVVSATPIAGGKAPKALVTGKVYLNGQPLQGGQIQFVGGELTMLPVQKDGTYAVSLLPGEYRVLFINNELAGPPVPALYTQLATTPLRFGLTPGTTKATYDIKLNSK